jgi:nitronate monooxygenase
LLRTQLEQVHGTFGIGLVDWVMRNEAGLLEDALAARPALLSVGRGEIARGLGALTAGQTARR